MRESGSRQTGLPAPAGAEAAAPQERRRAYRVPAEARDGIEIVLRTADGTSFRGELLDVSLLGAGAGFHGAALPELGTNAAVVLVIATAEGSVEVRARVRSIFYVGSYERYGFEFEDPRSLRERLLPRWLSVFNQRRDPRALPASDEAVAVALRMAGERALRARMLDLSAGGMSVSIEAARDAGLQRGDVVDVDFSLPGPSRAFRMVTRLRWSRVQGDRVLYGMEFDAERTEDFAAQRAEITRFVHARLGGAPAPGSAAGEAS